MTFTFDEVVHTAREVIAEAGEYFVYDKPYGDCFYREPDGSPSCLVGRIFDKIGVDMDELFPRTDIEDNFAMNNYEVSGLPIESRFTRDAWKFLIAIQQEQDGHGPWGDCLRVTLERVDLGFGTG